MMFGYLEETLACSKEYKRRPRPTHGCRADDDDDDDMMMKRISCQ
jgi:hypothetical protein